MKRPLESLDDVNVGEVVKTKHGKFLKVKSVEPNNNRIKGIDAFKDDDDSVDSNTLDIEKALADEIDRVLNKREFGQVKRFKKRGCGFKKIGRKLKYNRSKHIDEGISKKVRETVKRLRRT